MHSGAIEPSSKLIGTIAPVTPFMAILLSIKFSIVFTPPYFQTKVEKETQVKVVIMTITIFEVQPLLSKPQSNSHNPNLRTK